MTGQAQPKTMQAMAAFSGGGLHRYSAKRMTKPVNFFCHAPEAQHVAVLGDFNEWRAEANPMQRQPDGGWAIQIPLHHGHHLYVFLVDGKVVLDPRAQGIARNARNERVSMLAVS
ncbi:MAG TPA: isoamylase early set domain-containing protein [Verrucomicrobiota bacterium]|nr:isoamylase early set domain-containing protein [Verrucomicrobiota bacterium]HNU51766.1 isoamylase early set domain-containing protein [Verrucomicrobiota bacterium]